jgi:hypothetical protein
MTEQGANVYIMNDSGKTSISDIKCEDSSESEARAAGFWGVNCVDWIPKDLMALDKALHFFCKKELDPEYVWFIEDDVFVPRVDLISEIDSKYPDADLITKSHVPRSALPNWPGWDRTDLAFLSGQREPYHSLCCAMRLSRRMLTAVAEFVEKRGRLVFLEFFFNTLANQHGFKVETPEELSTIQFESQNHVAFDKNHLYHAVKDNRIHHIFRYRLSQGPQAAAQ